MYSGADLQAIQSLQGGGFVATPSSAGAWTQQTSSSSGRKSSKGPRGGSASKGPSIPVHTLTPVGRQVAYIDANTGNFVAQSGAAQAFARPTTQQQSTGRAPQQVVSAQTQQAPTIVQVHAFQHNGTQQQPQPQLLQAAPAGPQMYKVTNGTRVVKAGQPYPNTTIVQTAVAVPTGPQQLQQPQQQQQGGVITIRSQQPQQQQLNPQGQILQLQLGGGIQLATGGAAQQPPQQQQPSQQQAQQAKLTLMQQAPQPHVLVAQPQQQVPQQQILHHLQQQAQLLHGKQQLLQQRQSSAPAAFQAVAVRPAGAGCSGGGGAAAAIRPASGGPITLQPVYAAAPSNGATVARPAMRIPKLGTVATYNPVTGVRSAATSASGGVTAPLLPANLPATLVQQVQKANMLQQQQHTAAAAASGAGAGGMTSMLQVQPHVQGQALVRPMGAVNGVLTAAGSGGGGGGPQQRQTTLVVGGARNGMAAAVQGPLTHMGIAVGGGSLQQLQPPPQQQQAQQMMHQAQPIHVVATGGPPPMQLQQQQQQQVVNITLADGTTAITVMDQATLTRMLSESSRGQAVKLQQQQQQQEQRQQLPPGGAVGPSSIQGQLQALPLQHQQSQPQQVLLQAGTPLGGPGLLTVLAGSGSGGKGPGGVGVGVGRSSFGGVEQLGGLQTVHLAGAAASASAASGAVQLLIRSGSSSGSQPNGNIIGASSSGRGLPPPPGMSQGPHLRAVQVMGPSANHGSMQLQPQQQQGEFYLGAQQHQMLQQQQPLEQQLQHQVPLGRRPSGKGLAGEVDAGSAALLEPSFMALAQFQGLGAQRMQQQQPTQQQQTQQQQQIPALIGGTGVVELDGTLGQQQRLQQQQQQQSVMGSAVQLPQRQPSGAAAQSDGLLQHGGGGGVSISTPGGFMMMPDDSVVAAASMTAASFTLGGGDAAAGATVFGGAGGVGSSREDLKAILLSIGQELARHGISVETAVTSGWLGVLTAMDVAVLADAYTDEERRLMMTQKALPQAATQQQPGSHGGAQGSAADSAPLPQTQPPLNVQTRQQLQLQLQLQPQHGPGETGPAGGGIGGVDCRSGSSGERGSSATAPTVGIASSSARTSMSVAPSDDGASTASGVALGGMEPGMQHAPGGSAGGSTGGGAASAGSMYDLGKFNAFQYGYLGAGMLSALGGGDASSDLEKLAGGGSEADRDVDGAGMADVFGEKPWPPFGVSVMAEEIGLSAQSHLQEHRHHFPPPHASTLLGGRGGSGGAVPKLIDSASEYEARHPLLQATHQHQMQPNPGGGRSGDRPALQLNGGGGWGGLGLHSAMSASSMGGDAGASKGYSSAPGGMFSSAGGGDGAVDLDKEIENRFANLDLGCGFY